MHSPLYMQCILKKKKGEPGTHLVGPSATSTALLPITTLPPHNGNNKKGEHAADNGLGHNGRGKSPAVKRMQGLTHALYPDGCVKRNGDQVRGGKGAESMQQQQKER